MNVILVIVDALRADHLGCYGYKDCKNISPNIDELAKNGVLFQNAFSHTSCTHPSFTTMLTGMHPISHTIVSNMSSHEIPENVVLISEILKDKGLTTVTIDNLMRWFVKGFDFYICPRGILGKISGASVQAEEVNEQCIKWFDNYYEKKDFFMLIHYWDPHIPYNPPKPFKRMYYQGDEKDPTHPNKSEMEELRQSNLDLLFKTYSNYKKVNDINYFIAQYDAEISYVDHQIGTLIKKIDELGILDDTCFILTADHGESLTEHRTYFTHSGLYDPSIHVPLIFSFPSKLPIGKIIESNVRHVDLAPTILELLNTPIPEHMEGNSILPLIRGQSNVHPTEVFLFEQESACKRGVRTDKWKFIKNLKSITTDDQKTAKELQALGYMALTTECNTVSKELYDLENDSLELNNLINARTDIADSLERKIDTFVENRLQKLQIEDPQLVQKIKSFPKNITLTEWLDDLSQRISKFHNYLDEEKQITDI